MSEIRKMAENGLRVLVCGGRTYRDEQKVFEHLDRLHSERPIGVLIEGDCPGADRIAGHWARRRKVLHWKCPADWETYGRKAGPIRNREMLKQGKPDVVLAFPGGSGTAYMVRIAKEAGVEIVMAQ